MDNVVSQQIPHDSEAEKAVLGAVFLDPEAIIDASDILQPDDFYEHANRIVFQAMLNISDREEVIDPVTLQDELKKNNQVDDIGGIAYVTEPTGRFVALSDLSTITVLTPKNGGRTSPSTQIRVHITTRCTINFNTFDIGNLPLSY